MLLPLLLSACQSTPDEAPPIEGVVVEQMPMEAVFRVSWSTETEASGVVQCDDGVVPTKDIVAESTEDGLEHTALLAGLGEGTSWSCVARSGKSVSEAFVIEVPVAPTDLPGLVLTVPNTTDLSGFTLITQPLPPSSVSILDREGRRTWWHQGEGEESFNEAWMTPDGKYIWMQSVGDVDTFQRVSLDGSELLVVEVKDAHHDFYALDTGGFMAIREDIRSYEVDGETYLVAGDEVAEYDVEGTKVRVLWNSWDTLTVPEDELPDGGPIFDWTHANAIHPAADDTWLISLWSARMILRVNDSDGSEVWRICAVKGAESDFELAGDGDPFRGQHGVRLEGNVLSVFNNRNLDPAGADDLWSEAVEYVLDEDAGTYSRRWSYDAGKQLYAAVLGNLDPLPNGHRYIGWGGAGRLTELAADDTVLWQVDADLGGSFGYTHTLGTLAGAGR